MLAGDRYCRRDKYRKKLSIEWDWDRILQIVNVTLISGQLAPMYFIIGSHFQSISRPGNPTCIIYNNFELSEIVNLITKQTHTKKLLYRQDYFNAVKWNFYFYNIVLEYFY